MRRLLPVLSACAILVGCEPTSSVANRPPSEEPKPVAQVEPTSAPTVVAAPPPLTSAAPSPVPLTPPGPRPVVAERLQALVAKAHELGTDELIIWQEGRVLDQFGADGAPIQSMSITKSVLGLAALILIQEGKLQLEQPVSEFFPAWKTGGKAKVLVRHLLSHSSGLSEPKSTLPIYRSDDFVQYALDSKLEAQPGERFIYGNSASNLLSGLIEKASGKRADRFVAERLFKPLGIARYWWSLDKAKHAHGMSGLHINAIGLLKLGQLVLGGRNTRQPNADDAKPLIDPDLLRRATTELAPVQPNHKRLGLLWWLIPETTELGLTSDDIAAWQTAKLDPAFVVQMKPLVGRRFKTADEYREAVKALRPDDPELERWDELTWKAGLPDVTYRFGPIIGCYSAGTLGQYLVILPRDRLIAVRMRKAPKRRKEHDPNDFPDFIERVRELVEAP
ncbi:MAG: serine hydrolase [Polyangiaceae bacterium]